MKGFKAKNRQIDLKNQMKNEVIDSLKLLSNELQSLNELLKKWQSFNKRRI